MRPPQGWLSPFRAAPTPRTQPAGLSAAPRTSHVPGPAVLVLLPRLPAAEVVRPVAHRLRLLRLLRLLLLVLEVLLLLVLVLLVLMLILLLLLVVLRLPAAAAAAAAGGALGAHHLPQHRAVGHRHVLILQLPAPRGALALGAVLRPQDVGLPRGKGGGGHSGSRQPGSQNHTCSPHLPPTGPTNPSMHTHRHRHPGAPGWAGRGW